jgi:hypothetical protein
MKNRQYTPKAVHDGKFKGSVTVEQFTFKERFEESDAAAKAKNEDKYTPYLIELIEKTKKRLVVVDLERVSDGERFTKADDLEHGPDCHAILIDVGTWLINGDEKAGKNADPKSASSSAPTTED